MRPAVGGRPTVLHYCQHSVGLGHLVRSLSVAGALARSFRVVLVSGGAVPSEIEAPEGVELRALPPVGSGNGAGSGLVSLEPGVDLGEAFRRRQEILLGLLDELEPVALLIEMFPLGRRKFAGELLPLLEAARALRSPPVIACSVRDILVANGPEQQSRDDEATRRLNQYFDVVIVHADPRLIKLDETFRPSTVITSPVLYSGFVVPTGERPSRTPRVSNSPPEVLVSAGGGMVGATLLRTAAEAHRLHLAAIGITTRIVTGPFLPAEDALALHAVAAHCPGLKVERFVPDLCAAMTRASASVSQCGYNTALDVVRAGVPALVVPYDAGRETEQTERASRLAALSLMRVLPTRNLSPARLAYEIVQLFSSAPTEVQLDLNGAEATAEIVARLVAESGDDTATVLE